MVLEKVSTFLKALSFGGLFLGVIWLIMIGLFGINLVGVKRSGIESEVGWVLGCSSMLFSISSSCSMSSRKGSFGSET